ncbi:N-acetylmuramoyl-L-alanine amidase [Paracoccus tibetensis]|uniref:N-acetylmuramoyl-L-alanine amidase n=1 Tax=Paracoccus tibetensis TaxID=336292 RepID=A0A1G5HD48_9RHOB|nr:N-acetylmuramoyl-L-alanine amidase [Paracoccus tibetensis]
MTREPTRLIQTGLAALGYDVGRAGADGLVGPDTLAAGRAWLAAGGKAAMAPVAPPPPSKPTGAMIYQGAARYPVREIIVHCAATRADWMAGRALSEKVAEIRRWHLANGWNDIGYHHIIDRDGSTARGRAETVIGSHTLGKNSGTIGICLLGGHGSAETDRFLDHFTPEQDRVLRQMIASIGLRTQIQRVSGHNEYAAKACPGFNVPLWLKR